MNCLFQNANIIANERIADIGIVDGKIHFPLKENAIHWDQIVDLKGKIVFKGFADIHTHLDKAMVTDYVKNESGTLQEAIDIMGKYKANMSDEEIYSRAKKVIEMCYRNGTRYLRTHVDVDNNIQSRSIKVLSTLKNEYQDKLYLDLIAFPQEGILQNNENYLALEQALKDGASIIGGIPANEANPKKHIEMIFDLAKKYDVDIDMHIDENDNPDSLTILELIKQTIANNYQGRVLAGHLCSLGSSKLEVIQEVLERIKEAQIKIISLPSTNLYLEGRNDIGIIRRGIAPIKMMYQEYRIDVAIASDNIRDPFNPFGNGNPLQTALITAHACHMGGVQDLEDLFDMISSIPMKMMGFQPTYNEGEKAQVVVLDANTKDEAIISQASVLYAI
ncbi:MAG: amidohydrolase family protein [Solobacterium sp.]|nr:amidohydrolase family protein [Solobacterium sp.]